MSTLNLEKILKQKNVSQAQLARWCGVSRVAVTYWVQGKNRPSYEMLNKIAEVLNCSMDELTNTRSETRRLIDNKLDTLTEKQLEDIWKLIK